MARTPSVGRRFVVVGVGFLAALVLAFDLLVLVSASSGRGAGFPRLSRLLAIEAVITVLVVALVAVVLRWTAEIATKPLEEIDARHRTERRLAQQDAGHLSAIVESSDRAMLSTDASGAVLTWNPAAERLYGYSAAEAVGRNLADLIIPADQMPGFYQALAAVARGEVIQREEVTRRRKDGSLLPVAVTIAPLLDASGTIYGACSVARDMTDERRLACRLEASLTALAAAAEQAQQSEARTRRFLDDAAHQLRSPITSIRACAETLSLSVTAEQRDRLLGAVCRESERAGRLMAGLLRMARLGHDETLELEPTDVLALCEEQAERARLDSPHLAVTARVVGPALGPAGLAAGAVREILSNLVDNACRHAATRIDLTACSGDHGVALRVTDDGPGLPDGHTESIFERFVSLDGQGGTGLGLAIARELARTHGGDLTYESAAFVLRLPCEFGPIQPRELSATLGEPTLKRPRSAVMVDRRPH